MERNAGEMAGEGGTAAARQNSDGGRRRDGGIWTGMAEICQLERGKRGRAGGRGRLARRVLRKEAGTQAMKQRRAG